MLVLAYHAAGDFYIFGKDWDLSDGIVRPDDAVEEKRSRTGESTLIGLPAEELIRVLTRRLAARP